MGHHNWLMPVGWRAAPPAVRWQQAKPLAEKRTGIAGNADAACELGMLYQSGTYADAPPVNPVQAAHWYGEAAALGNGCGIFALAALYQDGEGLTKDPAKASQLFAQAAPLGYVVDRTTFPLEQINRHFHAVAITLAGQPD